MPCTMTKQYLRKGTVRVYDMHSDARHNNTNERSRLLENLAWLAFRLSLISSYDPRGIYRIFVIAKNLKKKML